LCTAATSIYFSEVKKTQIIQDCCSENQTIQKLNLAGAKWTAAFENEIANLI